ncbi:MAG: PQQ-dependent sugar dehydrogenase [Acidobacteriota bacterium]
MRSRLPLSLSLWVAASSLVIAPCEGAPVISISLQPIASGLSSPVYVTNAGDGSGRLFVVEQPGTIRIYKNGSLLAAPFLDIRTKVLSGGERGLLSTAFHPRFESNRRFFVYYTRQTDGDLVISEFTASAANPDQANTTERQLLIIDHTAYSNHNGGQLHFGPDGFLYIFTGDGGGGGDPLGSGQNINSFLGKVLRVDVDSGSPYGIPSDNPYAAAAGLDEIYATGFRNPWRASFDRLTGALYAGDVGQNAWEEVDVVQIGRNYGWNIMEGSHCYPPGSSCNAAGLVQPVVEYSHAGGNCSITGGYVYRGSMFPALAGTYFYADFCTGIIWGLGGGVASQLLDTNLSIASFGEDETGELYIVDLGGTVSRIVGPPGPCTLTCPRDITVTDLDGDGSEKVTFSDPQTSGACGIVTCAPPSGSAFPLGTTQVNCTSSEGGGSCTFSVTVLARTSVVQVLGCRPPGGPAGARLDIRVIGTGFAPGAGLVLGEGIKPAKTRRVSAKVLTATIKIMLNARKGFRNVTVKNPDGTRATCTRCFRVK